MAKGRMVNRCDYVIRQAGKSFDGRPIELGGHGDKTQICGRTGRRVIRQARVKAPATAAGYEFVDVLIYRCPEHEEG